jgi:Lysine-specific metallo-endopeptidase
MEEQPAGDAATGFQVQRATPSEFAIRGKYRKAASELKMIFFDLDSSAVDTDEQAKIPALATPPGAPLTLRSSGSEEGPGTHNAALTDQRMRAVTKRLHDAGWLGTPTLETVPGLAEGDLDYRRMRSVEVRQTGTPSSLPDCHLGPAANDCGAAPNPFTTALDQSTRMVDKAIAEVPKWRTDATVKRLLDQLFGGPAAERDVVSNLGLLKGQFANMAPFNGSTGHRCVDQCDSLCIGGALAYNRGRGAGAGALMTLCPGFMSLPDVVERASGLIHEGAHATAGFAARDVAYRWERLLAPSMVTGQARLSKDVALNNADSYAMLVVLINNPGSIPLGPAAQDTFTSAFTPVQREAIELALAWMQAWVINTRSQIAGLYGEVHATMRRPAAPGTSPWQSAGAELLMRDVARNFGLTAPPRRPKMHDEVAVAGIADRYADMGRTLRGALDVQKAPGADTTWQSGPGARVEVGSGFFALPVQPAAELLLRRLVRATATVPTYRRAAYVELVLKVRAMLGTPSP